MSSSLKKIKIRKEIHKSMKFNIQSINSFSSKQSSIFKVWLPQRKKCSKMQHTLYFVAHAIIGHTQRDQWRRQTSSEIKGFHGDKVKDCETKVMLYRSINTHIRKGNDHSLLIVVPDDLLVEVQTCMIHTISTFLMDLQPTLYIKAQKVSISWRDREPMCGSAFSASHFLHLTYMHIPFHILNYVDSLSSIELLNCFSAHCLGCVNGHKFHCLHQAHSEMQWTVFSPMKQSFTILTLLYQLDTEQQTDKWSPANYYCAN